MAQQWLHCECSEVVSKKLLAEFSSPSRSIGLAETLQLSAVVVAFDSLKRMDKSIKVRPSQLTVLLPFH